MQDTSCLNPSRLTAVGRWHIGQEGWGKVQPLPVSQENRVISRSILKFRDPYPRASFSGLEHPSVPKHLHWGGALGRDWLRTGILGCSHWDTGAEAVFQPGKDWMGVSPHSAPPGKDKPANTSPKGSASRRSQTGDKAGSLGWDKHPRTSPFQQPGLGGQSIRYQLGLGATQLLVEFVGG